MLHHHNLLIVFLVTNLEGVSLVRVVLFSCPVYHFSCYLKHAPVVSLHLFHVVSMLFHAKVPMQLKQVSTGPQVSQELFLAVRHHHFHTFKQQEHSYLHLLSRSLFFKEIYIHFFTDYDRCTPNVHHVH